MKYFVKNKKIKITAIIIFLVLMVSIIDFGFLKSEITNYQMRCHILDNTKSCYVSSPITYKVSTEQQLKSRSESEEPVKKDDDAMDTLKYLIMTRPAKPHGIEKPKTRLQKDFERLSRGPVAFSGDDWDQD